MTTRTGRLKMSDPNLTVNPPKTEEELKADLLPWCSYCGETYGPDDQREHHPGYCLRAEQHLGRAPR